MKRSKLTHYLRAFSNESFKLLRLCKHLRYASAYGREKPRRIKRKPSSWSILTTKISHKEAWYRNPSILHADKTGQTPSAMVWSTSCRDLKKSRRWSCRWEFIGRNTTNSGILTLTMKAEGSSATSATDYTASHPRKLSPRNQCNLYINRRWCSGEIIAEWKFTLTPEYFIRILEVVLILSTLFRLWRSVTTLHYTMHNRHFISSDLTNCLNFKNLRELRFDPPHTNTTFVLQASSGVTTNYIYSF
jgi:hypothetical protein